MFEAAQTVLNENDLSKADETVQRAIDYFGEALRWMRANEATHFPGGLYITYSNVYEYTDATGDMGSCPTAKTLGFDGNIPQMRDAYMRISEEYMRLAVETRSDMVLLLEHFCGHGFHSDDPESPCYRGPNQENWFDGTCIHPTPTGHQSIAELFGRYLEP